MIKEAFQKFVHHWVVLLKDHAFVVSLLIGLGLLISAYFVNYAASVYADSRQFLSVGDMILDNIPVFNLHFFYTWVMYALMVGLFAYPILFKPEICPFAMKTFAMLIYLRCGFILLTNIGPPVGFFYEGVEVGGSMLADVMFKNDLFFSGHTAYPFMGFLIFRESFVKWIFLTGSILMGITVILMHIHYSIDVFAAFFITYGVYSMSDKIFNRLNLRFTNRLKLYGWNALQKLKNFKK